MLGRNKIGILIMGWSARLGAGQQKNKLVGAGPLPGGGGEDPSKRLRHTFKGQHISGLTPERVKDGLGRLFSF